MFHVAILNQLVIFHSLFDFLDSLNLIYWLRKLKNHLFMFSLSAQGLIQERLLCKRSANLKLSQLLKSSQYKERVLNKIKLSLPRLIYDLCIQHNGNLHFLFHGQPLVSAEKQHILLLRLKIKLKLNQIIKI